jgi:SAM-dependent methyltransferase
VVNSDSESPLPLPPGAPEEPLGESAPIAWREAPRRCAASCMAYHRVWQYLRWLGLISSIRTNSEFLIRTFRSLAPGRPRVLVSGTADYGMLAHLHHAYASQPLEATVVDLCPTPLLLNAWYADRVGRRVVTAQSDILEYASHTPFDLIATHNFLGRFEPAGRRRLASTWHGLLRPGGVIVTTQRVRPSSPQTGTAFTAEEAAALATRAERAALRAGLPPGDAQVFHECVRAYALRRATTVIRSTAEITDVLSSCGFDVELVDEGGGPDERYRDRPSSTAGLETFRMRVIARRRAAARADLGAAAPLPVREQPPVRTQSPDDGS